MSSFRDKNWLNQTALIHECRPLVSLSSVQERMSSYMGRPLKVYVADDYQKQELSFLTTFKRF